MENFISNLTDEVDRRLRQIEQTNEPTLEKARQSVECMDRAMQRLKEFTTGYTFPDEAHEVRFFREQKPCLLSKLLYHSRIYEIEISLPAAGKEAQAAYFRVQAQRITGFFERNIEFFHYFRSGSTHLDRYYFIRGNSGRRIDEGYYYDRDPNFTTLYDYKVAKILANDLVQVYLREQFRIVEGDGGEPFFNLPKERLMWTGSKFELIELMYAIKAARCINNGKASINQIKRYLELMFNIDLGANIARSYLDISLRRNRSQFLDRLKKEYLEQMDELYAHDPARK